MSYLFTSESVSEGHPDKVADQISDALVDNFLAFDSQSKVACETLVTTGQVVLAGEVKTSIYIDVQAIAREVILGIGYDNAACMFEGRSCGVLSAIHGQSPDINQGVEKSKPEEQGAGDQGIIFGYATDETETYMPLTLDLAHDILRELSKIRREGKLMKYLRPDSKSQVTIEYSDNSKPIRIDTIVLSTQHDEEATQEQIRKDVQEVLLPRVKNKLPANLQALFKNDFKLFVNPTGKFVIGGPHGDTGLTGRKIIVDTYGGRCAHGGGAFSGKDPSKVDRSAAYATRHIAKNLVAAGVASEVLVQVAYAIGVAEPVSIYINTFSTSKLSLSDGEIAEKVKNIFDMRPGVIEQRLKLRNPIYLETASYGHFGRKSVFITKSFKNSEGKNQDFKVETFTWEKLDYVDKVKAEFGL